MEGIVESHNSVVHSICVWLGSISQAAKQINNFSSRDAMILDALRIVSVVPKTPSCKVVRWDKPPLG